MRKLVGCLAALGLAALSQVLSSSAAPAQGELALLMCQAKPTVACVLEGAISTATAAEAETKDNLPFARIVETAGKNNLVDLGLSLTGRIETDDTLGLAAFIEAAARAGRMAELVPLFKAIGATPSSYAFAIGPALAETGREDELAALVKTVDPAVAEQLPAWRIAGHLFAGRFEDAKKVIEALPDDKRVDLVLAASEYFIYDDRRAALAGHFLPYFPATDYSLIQRRANIVAALKDRDMALKLLDDLPLASQDEQEYAASAVVDALARSGAWEEALKLVETVEPDQQPFMLALIAGQSGQLPVFGMIEKHLNQAESFRRDGITRLLIRALVLAGYAPVAQTYVDKADTAHERDARIGFVAAARAELGQRSEAVGAALSIGSTYQRAWALWEVADKFRD